MESNLHNKIRKTNLPRVTSALRLGDGPERISLVSSSQFCSGRVEISRLSLYTISPQLIMGFAEV